jgi:organic radical activating enzyme
MSNNNIVAIRSLQCPDHAINIPPTVISINWFLGKRCNYDCSYCSPHIHDAVSPFVDQASAIEFIKNISTNVKNKNQKIKWIFTGGEPFIDPGFVPLLKAINLTGAATQVNVVTNGSLPLSTYLGVADLLSGITISLHPERSDKEIDQTIDKIIALSKSTSTQIAVNLMFATGRIDRYRQIIDLLRENNIWVVLRRITWAAEEPTLLPFVNNSKDKKARELQTIPIQSVLKQKYQDSTVELVPESYYTPDELKLLVEFNSDANWVNAGIWHNDNSYKEVNTDLIVAESKNKFKNWICFAGVDQLQVEFDGSIYAGLCLNNGPIGHISDVNIGTATQPTICQRASCTCNTDIAVRKAASAEYLHLVS